MKISIKQMMLLVLLIGIFLRFSVDLWRKAPAQSILAIAISPDGQTIATRSTGAIEVCNRRTGRRRTLLAGPMAHRYMSEYAPGIRFMDDETLLVSSKDWQVPQLMYLNVKSGKLTKNIVLPAVKAYEREHFVDKRLFSRLTMAKGSRYAVSFFDSKYPLRNLSAFTSTQMTRHVATSPDGKLAAINCEIRNGVDGAVLWDIEKAKELAQLPASAMSVFSPDSKTLLQFFGTNRLVDVATQESLWEFDFHAERAAFSSDGKRILFSNGVEICQVDAANGNLISQTKFESKDRVSCFDVCDDGKKAVFAAPKADAGFVELDLATGAIRKFGNYPRFMFALTYAFAFIAWAGVWAWIDRKQNPSRAFANPDFRWRTVWALFAFGGTVAICWSVFPLFYDLPATVFSTAQFIVFRLIFAALGIAIGVLALTRGLGTKVTLIKTTIASQITNMLNFDLLNLLIGFTLWRWFATSTDGATHELDRE